MSRPKLRFYDIKARQSFETSDYELVEKETSRGRFVFAVAVSPYSGIKVWRIVGKASD